MIALWKAKLRAAQAEVHEWTKAHNRATRRLARLRRDIEMMERKIDVYMAKAEQRTRVAARREGVGVAAGRTGRAEATRNS